MPADIVKFGDGLELDHDSYELRRAGRALKLERISKASKKQASSNI